MIFSMESGCCEWDAEADAILEAANSPTCKRREADCAAEKAVPESCVAGSGCKLDDSANDEAEVTVPSCLRMCSGYPTNNDDSTKDRIQLCKWLHSFPLAGGNVDISSCTNTCTSFDKLDIDEEYADCTQLLKHPNGCCETMCVVACSTENDARAGTFLSGICLALLGFILASSFACGICPICCCAKSGPTVVPVGAQPQVVMAQAMPQAQPQVVMAQAQPQVVMPQAQPQVVMAQAQPQVVMAQAQPVGMPMGK